MTAVDTDSIAIVGMACRFPGARNLAEYWAVLNRDVARSGADHAHQALLDSIDRFDAEFFRASDDQARYIDPQQRLLLELAWEALEDGAVPPRNLRGSRTGMFIGLCNHDMSVLMWPRASNAHMLTGVLNSLAANRVSHFFGLAGPSLCVDTACSSSLAAVHLACTSLKSGECSLALVGGVSIMTLAGVTEAMRHAGLISSAGRCRPFAADADGFVRAEGAGMVLLKSCREALRDGNRIYARIDGSAINYNGDSIGLVSPSPAAQRELLEQAYRAAGVDPSEVSYVEASATGSSQADAIECRIFTEFFLRDRDASKPGLAIGSSKPVLGHVEGVSGIASLIKVALALKEGAMPGCPRDGALNPMIAASAMAATFPEELLRWEAGSSGERIAGISSLGLGGSNAHVVVRQAPEETPAVVAANDPGPFVLPLSARTASALRELIAAYLKLLREDPGLDLYSLCHAAATGREHFPVRCALTARDAGEMCARLASAEREFCDGMSRGTVAPQAYVCVDGGVAVDSELLRRLRRESVPMRALVADVESEADVCLGLAPDTPLERFLAQYCLGRLIATYCPKLQGFVTAGRSELLRLALNGAIRVRDAARAVAGGGSPPFADRDACRAKRPRRGAHVIGLSCSAAGTAGVALRELVAPAQVRQWHSLAEHESVAGFLAAAYVSGLDIDWKQHYAIRPRQVCRLPHYPFQRARHWPAELEARDALGRTDQPDTPDAHLLELAGETIELPFAAESRHQYRLSALSGSALTASRVFGSRMVTPATQLLMAAVQRALEAGEGARWQRLRNVRMSVPIMIPDDAVVRAQLIISDARGPGEYRCAFVSKLERYPARGESGWTLGMEADCAGLVDAGVAARPDADESRRRQPEFDALESGRLHERLRVLGYECDPAHRWDFAAEQGEYWIGSPLRNTRRRGRLHPGMLDACLLAILLQLDPADSNAVWLPVSVDQLDICPADLADSLYSIRLTARTCGAARTSVDFDVADSAGRQVLVATGLCFEAVQQAGIPFAAAVKAEAGASPDIAARRLIETLGRLLGSALDEESLGSPLVRLGLDSLKALELRAGLRRDHGYEISQADMLNGLSGAALVTRLRAHLERRGGSGARETAKTQVIELRGRHPQDRLVQIEL